LTRCDERGGVRPRARQPYRNRRGEDLHLGLAAYVLRDAEQARGHVVIFQDVTEVVEMEGELRRSERLAAVGRLSASIAHEIRNPLAAISGSIQMLSRRMEALEPAGEARQLMDIVLRETDRLNRLVTDFLHYARPGPPRRESLRVAELIAEVGKMFEAARPEAVRLEVDVPADLSVSADAAQLRQVLWNLVLNACQAMPSGGRLRISARPAAEPEPQGGSREGRREVAEKSCGVEISVADEGIGIAPEVMERIFDPFFTTRREGSGLGLATVHRIVEEHGGSIRVESAPGKGTSVRVRLPGEGDSA
jgi:two-component system sensor histidine kinase PilS (NtrC family)